MQVVCVSCFSAVCSVTNKALEGTGNGPDS